MRAQSGAVGGFSVFVTLERRGSGTKGAAAGFKVVVGEDWFMSLMLEPWKVQVQGIEIFVWQELQYTSKWQSPRDSTPTDAQFSV